MYFVHADSFVVLQHPAAKASTCALEVPLSIFSAHVSALGLNGAPTNDDTRSPQLILLPPVSTMVLGSQSPSAHGFIKKLSQTPRASLQQDAALIEAIRAVDTSASFIL